MLPKKSKARRRKINDVNIKVTFIAWLMEFLGSFVAAAIPAIFGHGQIAYAALQILALFFYFVLLPFFYLLNDSEVKSTIAEESWVRAIRGIFNRSNTQVLSN